MRSLSGGHDRTAVGIVFGVGRKDKDDVQGHTEFETADLDIALLEDIKQRNLYTRLEVGYFINDKDAAVAFGDDAVMNDALVGKAEPQVGGLDGIYVANQVGHANVGGGQLFAITLAAAEPGDQGVSSPFSFAISSWL